MKLWVNGEARELPEATDIAALIAHLELPAAAVLVEHNGTALRRDEWPTRIVREGDRFELIRIVAGG